jgi:tRNA splicing ligase
MRIHRSNLDYHVDEGLVRLNPEGELNLWAYTVKAYFDRNFFNHPLLRMCRGLVTVSDGEYERIISRPFQKFFNTGEHTL